MATVFKGSKRTQVGSALMAKLGLPASPAAGSIPGARPLPGAPVPKPWSSPWMPPKQPVDTVAPIAGAKALPGTSPAAPWDPGHLQVDAPSWLSGIAAAAAGKDPSTDLSWQDSGYNTTVANLLAQKNQGANAITAAGRRAAEDRAKNKSLLAEGTAKSKTSATQSANKSGLFYSGTLGKNLGDIDTDANRRTADVDTAFARGEEDRASQGAGLESQFNAAQQAAAQQAIDRWIKGAEATESASTPSLDALIAALTAANAPRSNARKS